MSPDSPLPRAPRGEAIGPVLNGGGATGPRAPIVEARSNGTTSDEGKRPRRAHEAYDRPNMLAQADTGEPGLRDYLDVLRRRKLIILLVTVLACATAFGASLAQTPVYEATAEVLLQQRPSERIFAPDARGGARASDGVRTEIEVMRSRSVLDAVTQALGVEPDVSITARGETEVVAITAESSDPAEAARIANTYAQTYIDTRRQQLVDDLLSAAEQVQSRIDNVDAQLQALTDEVAALDAAIAAGGPDEQVELLRSQRDRLAEEVANRRLPLLSQRTAYSQQLDELQLASSITENGGGRVVSTAETPGAPVRPKTSRNLLLGAVVGLMLGIGLAFLREHLDDTIKSKDDLERATGGLVPLALVPTVGSWKDRQRPYVVSLEEPSSAAAEAYRSLRTSVQFIGLDTPLRVIQVTGSNAGDGKTTTLANLAVALARAGQRVVVVCCDLHRPRIHEFFGLENRVGLTSVLLGKATVGAALQSVPRERNIAVLAAGPPPPNPSELLSSPRVANILASLTELSDVVLVDSSPILPVTDGLVVSHLVDATILVACAKVSTQQDTHRALELLRQVDAPLIGSVLNRVEAEDLYGYGSYNYSGPRRRRA
ncbi:MAG: polysaccharide biosynthesis tyrosine autokinase [Acidimicrobiia bacterium]|nr:polysaccharide biosynthesis tyrosine autokinase [Acidimicrobiia bacterium]